jgi:hypothetical protein
MAHFRAPAGRPCDIGKSELNQVLIQRWRQEYIIIRLRSSLDNKPGGGGVSAVAVSTPSASDHG